MRNLNLLNKHRIELMGFMGDERNGAFQIPIRGKMYRIIASDGLGWEHVSISNKAYTPTWEVMCDVKELFFKDEEVVIQYHPKKSEYINNHKHCLHLWKPKGVDIPTPNSFLVGIKDY